MSICGLPWESVTSGLCVDTGRSSWASSQLSWPSLCLSARIDGCVGRGRGSTGSRLIQLSLACCHLLCQDSLRVSTGRQEGPERTEAWQALWRPEIGAVTMSFCSNVLANMCTSGDWLQCGGRCPLSQGSAGKSLVSERGIRVTGSQGVSFGGGCCYQNIPLDET